MLLVKHSQTQSRVLFKLHPNTTNNSFFSSQLSPELELHHHYPCISPSQPPTCQQLLKSSTLGQPAPDLTPQTSSISPSSLSRSVTYYGSGLSHIWTRSLKNITGELKISSALVTAPPLSDEPLCVCVYACMRRSGKCSICVGWISRIAI